MNTHRIVPLAGAYRIEAISPTGERWLLRKAYPTGMAAMTRLQAMAEADMAEHERSERQARVVRA